jgi:cobalt-zinc-cadmium efflux system outer membrane protein
MTRNATLFALFVSATPAVWAQDHSTTLEDALKSARQTRPTLAAAEQRRNAARLSRKAQGAWPTTRLAVGFTTDPETGGSDDDLVLSQPIDFFGRTSAAAAVGDAQIAEAEANYQITLAGIQSEVIDAYSTVAASQQLAESSEESVEIAQKLHDAVKSLVDEGRLPGVQLTRVRIELERANLALSQRMAEQAAARQRLSALIGVPAASILVPDFATVAVPKIDPAKLVENRADLLLLAAEARVLDAEARVASLGNRPEFEVQARRNAWQDEDARYGLRLQLNIPINDFGRVRNETAAARAQADAARKALADARNLAEAELQATQIELEAATDQVRRYEEIRVAAESLLRTSQAGFAERAITLIEFLEAARARREVEEGWVEARLRLAHAQGSYLRASGQILEASN